MIKGTLAKYRRWVLCLTLSLSDTYLLAGVLISMPCRYLPGPDDMLVLDIAYTIYLKFEEYPSALQIALFLDNMQVCTSLSSQTSSCPSFACVRSGKWDRLIRWSSHRPFSFPYYSFSLYDLAVCEEGFYILWWSAKKEAILLHPCSTCKSWYSNLFYSLI